MFSIASLITMATASWIVQKLDKATDYKKPVGKHKNRYK